MKLPKAILASVVLALLAGLMLSTTALAAPPTLEQETTRSGPWGIGAVVRETVSGGFAKVGDVVARLVGLTHEEIEAERDAGKSLAQIAGEREVDEQQVVDAVLQERRPVIEDIVSADRATQAQSEYALNRMQERIVAVLQRIGHDHQLAEGGWGRADDHGGVGRGGRGLQDGDGRWAQRLIRSAD